MYGRKVLAALALAASMFGSTAAAQTTDMSGEWRVWSLATTATAGCTQFIGQEVIYHVSLSQDGAGNLTGLVAFADTGAPLAPVTGTVVGQNVSITGSATLGANTTTFTYSFMAPAGAEMIFGGSNWTVSNGVGTCGGTDDAVARRWGVMFCEGTAGQCPCNNTSAFGGCANSTGQGAVLTESGLASFSTDTLQLSVTGARPSQPGMFVQGSFAISVPFKDGRLCMGNPTERLEVAFTDPAGNASSSVSVSVEGNVPLGVPIRHYQYWYRDPQLSPCGAGSNFSNALTIAWLP